jgi:hypothetical protein
MRTRNKPLGPAKSVWVAWLLGLLLPGLLASLCVIAACSRPFHRFSQNAWTRVDYAPWLGQRRPWYDVRTDRPDFPPLVLPAHPDASSFAESVASLAIGFALFHGLISLASTAAYLRFGVPKAIGEGGPLKARSLWLLVAGRSGLGGWVWPGLALGAWTIWYWAFMAGLRDHQTLNIWVGATTILLMLSGGMLGYLFTVSRTARALILERATHQASECPQCGYNLSGLAPLVCPECGRSCQPTDWKMFALGGFWRRMRARGFARAMSVGRLLLVVFLLIAPRSVLIASLPLRQRWFDKAAWATESVARPTVSALHLGPKSSDIERDSPFEDIIRPLPRR